MRTLFVMLNEDTPVGMMLRTEFAPRPRVPGAPLLECCFTVDERGAIIVSDCSGPIAAFAAGTWHSAGFMDDEAAKSQDYGELINKLYEPCRFWKRCKETRYEAADAILDLRRAALLRKRMEHPNPLAPAMRPSMDGSQS